MSHAISLSFIAAVILCSLGILADAAIVYGVFRFKRLKTVPNIFLANWAIADLLSIVIMPTNTVVYVFMFSSGHLTYLCLTINATVSLHLAVVLFGIILSIDWFTAAYYPRMSEKFRGSYLIIIGLTWSIVLLLYILSVSLCITNTHLLASGYLFVIFYVINLLFVIALQCSKVIQKCKTGSTSYPNMLHGRLTVITIITCSYLIGIVNGALTYADVYNLRNNFVASAISMILSIVTILCSSVLTLGVICWLDKDFRLCVFPIGKTTHDRFENEESESEEKEESPSDVNNSSYNVMPNSNQI